ncbi:MAG: carboxypeptidase-like regulatory domain-containing protein [Bacteroidia bacterium]
MDRRFGHARKIRNADHEIRNKIDHMRILPILLMICALQTFAQSDPKQKTIAYYDTVLTRFPREKIYLHFDKSTYLNTDTIWFKAYLVHGSLHTPSSISQLLYTELLNDEGEVIKRLSLPTAFGLSWAGYTMNADKIKPGTYTFRAYTNWMRNFGNQNFFTKEIKILATGSPTVQVENNQSKIPPISSRKDTSLKEKLRDLDVQFLPEGGSLLANRRQVVAFKALNTNGKGIKITGEVFDSDQRRVVSFSANERGMGSFSFHPQTDETYTAIVKFQGLTKKIEMPRAKKEGFALKVDNEYLSDSISITAFTTDNEQQFTLIGQSRGVVCFVAATKFTNVMTKNFKIAKSVFPTGVCQVKVVDGRNKTISQRNFFIQHKDQLKLAVHTPKQSYNLRDSIPVQINVANSEGNSTISSFSVAVTDDNQVSKDPVNDENILSYFLLSSDLTGEIERPGEYFQSPDITQHHDLEALMLTQGWGSYDWDITKNAAFKAEKEHTISGKVSNMMNKPLAKAKIILLGTSKSFILIDTITNENGEFVFNNLPLLDSSSFVIQAKNERGKIGTIGITMNEFIPPIPSVAPTKNTNYNLELIDSTSRKLISTKLEEYKFTARDGLLLKEITILGKRSVQGSKNLNGAGEADQIITDEELFKISKKTLYDILQEKVKGFRVGFPKKSSNRTFFLNSSLLKLVIDGIEVDFFYSNDGSPDNYFHYIKSYLDYYQAEDIKGIEVMDSRRYAMTYKREFMDPLDENDYSFLEITTKTGKGPFLKKAANMYLYKPVDYGDNKVFYSPKYSSANKQRKIPDFRSTIYWNPNLLTNEKGEGNFSFFSADKPGSYTVWIEGSDMQGNFGFKTMKLTIK